MLCSSCASRSANCGRRAGYGHPRRSAPARRLHDDLALGFVEVADTGADIALDDPELDQLGDELGLRPVSSTTSSSEYIAP